MPSLCLLTSNVPAIPESQPRQGDRLPHDLTRGCFRIGAQKARGASAAAQVPAASAVPGAAAAAAFAEGTGRLVLRRLLILTWLPLS